jgi:methylphosphotriester-DNA--protein-cysteine methyltransferase
MNAHDTTALSTRTALTGHPGRTARLDPQDRAREMSGMRWQGASLQQIGDAFGLTRERARQIVKASDGPTAEEVLEIQRRSRDAESIALARRIRQVAARHPGLTSRQLAEQMRVSSTLVRRALGTDASRLLVHPVSPRQAIPAEKMLEDLRRAAALVDGPLTAAGYERARRRFDGTSTAWVGRAFGGWTQACQAAGVTPGKRRRDSYRRRWSREDVVALARAYLSQEDSPGSYVGFVAFLKATPGAPSGPTARQLVGPWNDLKRQLLTEALVAAA